jgi:hypothetical protein
VTPDPLPPLVLGCRTGWRAGCGGGAFLLLALGTATLAGVTLGERAEPASILIGVGILLCGVAGAQFFLRYATARLTLDAGGFRLEGPFLAPAAVRWDEVREYHVRRFGLLPSTVHVVHGAERHLVVPLIFEAAHLLEVGLGQRGFPRF